MSRGPGNRQRALLAALDSDPEAVRVVPPGVGASEASVWRRAAKQLVATGQARAVYISAKSKDGRQMPHLMLTRPDFPILGNAYPIGAPRWVDPPPLRMETLSTRLQAVLVRTSQTTAYRLARKMREQPAA